MGRSFISLLSVLIISVLLVTYSCKKEEISGHPPGFSEPKAELTFNYNFLMNSQVISYDSLYTDAAGNVFKFDQITLILDLKLNGDNPDGVFHKTFRFNNPKTGGFQIATSYEYNYVNSLLLGVGFDTITNTNFLFQSPSIQDLLFDNTNQYIFIYLTGDVDTNGDGIFDDVFEYKVGTSQLHTTQLFAFNQKNTLNNIPDVTMEIDLDIMLDEINFADNRIVNSTTETLVSEQIVNNLLSAISIE